MYKKRKQSSSILSGFLAGMYMLLVLFAPSLHQHHVSGNLKLSDVSKSGKQMSVSSDSVAANDCLACHFLTVNHSIQPQEFDFNIQSYFTENIHAFSYTEHVVAQEKYTFPLRGPPAFRI